MELASENGDWQVSPTCIGDVGTEERLEGMEVDTEINHELVTVQQSDHTKEDDLSTTPVRSPSSAHDNNLTIGDRLSESPVTTENTCVDSVIGEDDNCSTMDVDEEDSDDEEDPSSREVQEGSRILKQLMSATNKSIAWPFLEAVDADALGLFDYYEKIKNPIWLRKMKAKFDAKEYQSITEFVADMRLMFENCYRYNGPDHPISKKAQKLETVMEQKLALLSRELREKTCIAATSGKKVEELVISGTRRRKALTPHDSSALLNQLRQEEKEKMKEMRQQQILEKKQAQEAYIAELQEWEDKTLFQENQKKQMTAMWEIPQIGLFLFLCCDMLNTGEVMHWELERCFLLPRASATIQKIMTALLSTPYQRTKLDKKPMMPYSVWEERLRVRLRYWYKLFGEEKNIPKICSKLGLEAKFFEVVGMRNPLEKKRYHELTYYQKVWIVKGLCDWCMETQESIRDAMDSQDVVEQREYALGTDAEGNLYIHFPQFCGQDLRIYRCSPFQLPKMEKPPKPDKKKEQFMNELKSKIEAARNHKGKKKPATPKKAKRPASRAKSVQPPVSQSPSPSFPRIRDERLRQNPRTVSAKQQSSNEESDASEEDVAPSKSSRLSTPVKVPSPSSTPSVSGHSTPVNPRNQRMQALIDDSKCNNSSRSSTPASLPNGRESSPCPSVSSTSSRSPKKTPRRGRRRYGRSRRRTPKTAEDSDGDDEGEDESCSADKVSQEDGGMEEAPIPGMMATQDLNHVAASLKEPFKSYATNNNVIGCDTSGDKQEGESSLTKVSRKILQEDSVGEPQEKQLVNTTSNSVSGSAEKVEMNLAIDKTSGSVELANKSGETKVTPGCNAPIISDNSHECSKDDVEMPGCDDLAVCGGQHPHPSNSCEMTDALVKNIEGGSKAPPFSSQNNCKQVSPPRQFTPLCSPSCDSGGEQDSRSIASCIRSQASHQANVVTGEDDPTHSSFSDSNMDSSSGTPNLSTPFMDTQSSERTGGLAMDENSCDSHSTIPGSLGSQLKEQVPDTPETNSIIGSQRSSELGRVVPDSVPSSPSLSNSVASSLPMFSGRGYDLHGDDLSTDSFSDGEGSKDGPPNQLFVPKEEPVEGIVSENSKEANCDVKCSLTTSSETHPKMGEEKMCMGQGAASNLNSDEVATQCVKSEPATLELGQIKSEVKIEGQHEYPSANGGNDMSSSMPTVKSEVNLKPEDFPLKKEECAPVKDEMGGDVKEEFGDEVKKEEEEVGDGVEKEEKEVGDGVKKEEDEEVGDGVKEEEEEEESDYEWEEVVPEQGAFELVVDSVESLRMLVDRFVEPEPIVVGRGKKSRVIKPPPRKRCVSELYERLKRLLKELEPWEQKLMQANKKAKLKMRKEMEEYKEEKEYKEDIWNSEEEKSSESEESSSEEETQEGEKSVDAAQEDGSPKKKVRRKVEEEVGMEEPTADDLELGISMHGRVRKRRFIPNNIEEQVFMKKKKTSGSQEPSPSPSPKTVPGTKNIIPQKPVTSLSLSGLRPEALAGYSLISINNQTMLVKGLNPQLLKQGQSQNVQAMAVDPIKNATLLAHLTGSVKPVQPVPTSSPASTAQLSTKDVIRELLSNKRVSSSAVPPQSSALSPAKPGLSVATTSSVGVISMASTSAPVLSSTLPVSAAGASVVDPQSIAKVTKIPCYNQTPLHQLPPAVIQQLLKGQGLKIQSPPAGSSLASSKVLPAAGATTAFSRLVRAGLLSQSAAVTSSVMTKTTAASAQKANILADHLQAGTVKSVPQVIKPVTTVSSLSSTSFQPIGAKISSQQDTLKSSQIQVTPELLAKLREDQLKKAATTTEGGGTAQAGVVKLLGQPPLSPKPRYASNVTVKSLLESRATHSTPEQITDIQTPTVVTVTQPAPVQVVQPTTTLQKMVVPQQPGTTMMVGQSQLQQILGNANLAKQLVLVPGPDGRHQLVLANQLQQQKATTIASATPAKSRPNPVQVVSPPGATDRQLLQLLPNHGTSVAMVTQSSTASQVTKTTVSVGPKMVRQEVIDRAVATVITTAPTTLPTVQMKVASPFEMPTMQPHRPLTTTTTAMKKPITAVPQITSHSKAPDGTVHNPRYLQTPASAAIKSAAQSMQLAAAQQQKNVILKLIPQSAGSPQKVIQGVVLQSGGIVPVQTAGTKGQVLVQQKGVTSRSSVKVAAAAVENSVASSQLSGQQVLTAPQLQQIQQQLARSVQMSSQQVAAPQIQFSNQQISSQPIQLVNQQVAMQPVSQQLQLQQIQLKSSENVATVVQEQQVAAPVSLQVDSVTSLPSATNSSSLTPNTLALSNLEMLAQASMTKEVSPTPVPMTRHTTPQRVILNPPMATVVPSAPGPSGSVLQKLSNQTRGPVQVVSAPGGVTKPSGAVTAVKPHSGTTQLLQMKPQQVLMQNALGMQNAMGVHNVLGQNKMVLLNVGGQMVAAPAGLAVTVSKGVIQLVPGATSMAGSNQAQMVLSNIAQVAAQAKPNAKPTNVPRVSQQPATLQVQGNQLTNMALVGNKLVQAPTGLKLQYVSPVAAQSAGGVAKTGQTVCFAQQQMRVQVPHQQTAIQLEHQTQQGGLQTVQIQPQMQNLLQSLQVQNRNQHPVQIVSPPPSAGGAGEPNITGLKYVTQQPPSGEGDR